jgi:DNA-binding helix-hairpin-helix protein with protein kinase domain
MEYTKSNQSEEGNSEMINIANDLSSSARSKFLEFPLIGADSWDSGRFKEVSRGGEATIYQLKQGLLGKVYHPPSSAEFSESPLGKIAAIARMKDIQTKLKMYPIETPDCVVTPSQILVVKNTGQVFGYIMEQVKGLTISDQTKLSKSLNIISVMSILERIYSNLEKVHAGGIVIGDLNENNMINGGQEIYFIDSDSMQFSGFDCKSFTPRFTAPELLEIKKTNLGGDEFSLVKKHTELTDWYSFMVISMRMLTNTDPYAGTINLEDIQPYISNRIMSRFKVSASIGDRIRHYVTVFDKRVIYPRTAKPLNTLPRKILEAFFETFENGKRFKPSKDIFSLT